METRIAVLALGMLLAGSFNTISTKYQDLYITGHSKDGTPLPFKHPAVQSFFMFLGECLCLIPYFFMASRRRRAKAAALADGSLGLPDASEVKPRSFYINRILVFALPALCDACATTLLNIGLFYTYASVYQMLRGTMVLFAGMFTIMILRRKLHIHHWLGMVLIMAGAALVGASSVFQGAKTNHGKDHKYAMHERFFQLFAFRGTPLDPHSSSAPADGATAPLFGDVLVVMAQLVTALQFILEEKYLKKYKVPTLLAVGVEGCWGMLLCCIALPLLTMFKASDGVPFDDAIAAAREIAASQQLTAAIVSSTVSIAFFNFFGISVTKRMSGAARATIDACRTLFIWLYALHVGWEKFHALEVVGFVVLISGTSLYNEILRACLPSSSPDPTPRSRRHEPRTSIDELTEPLLTAPGPTHPTHHSEPVPVPIAAARPRATAPRATNRITGSENMYTMARSMRLGASALSPHSLDSYDDRSSNFVAGSTPYDSQLPTSSQSPAESPLDEPESPPAQSRASRSRLAGALDN